MQIAVDCRCAETGREEVWVVEPVKAGQEITISYIRERQTDGREGEGKGEPRRIYCNPSAAAGENPVLHVLEIACHFGSRRIPCLEKDICFI